MPVVAAVTRPEGEATPWAAATLRAATWAAAADTLLGRVISQAAAMSPRHIMAAPTGTARALLGTRGLPDMVTRPAGGVVRGAVGAVAPGGAVTGAAGFGRVRFTALGLPGSYPFCPW